MSKHHCHSQPDDYLDIRHSVALPGVVALEFQSDNACAADFGVTDVVLDPAGRAAAAADLLTDHPTHTVTTFDALAATAARARKAEAEAQQLRDALSVAVRTLREAAGEVAVLTGQAPDDDEFVPVAETLAGSGAPIDGVTDGDDDTPRIFS